MKYKQVYLKALNLRVGDPIFSEISGSPAVDIHHIFSRGMGGSKEAERIENLMALTREEHEMYGDKRQHIAQLLLWHKQHLSAWGVEYDEGWIDGRIKRYR